MKIHIVSIETKHGNNLSAAATYEAAFAEVVKWATEEWRDDMGPMPESHEDIVEQYFDARDSETYYVDEVELLCDREPEPPAVDAPRWDAAIEAAIDRLLADYQIDGNYFANGGTRYFAVLGAVIDGEQSAAGTFDTLREATEWLSTGFDNDNPREPIVVVDIVTGQRYQPQTTVKVTLSEIEVQS